jgi:uncharacterized protein
MRWDRGHQSPNVVDARGRSTAGGSGLAWLLLSVGSRFGLPGVIVVLALVVCLGLFGQGQLAMNPGASQAPTTAAGEERPQFVAFVLDDVQQTWASRFAERGAEYRPAELVLFTDATSTSCGYGSAATGPFYCPLDQRVYIDLGFYDELAQRFGAPGDFAQAYVVAHEIGHHVQHQLGTDRLAGKDAGPAGTSVRLELQADCYAGIWAREASKRDLMEAGDIEEGIQAASAIGDDRLQRQQTGTVNPESWTHGSSTQRMHWFHRGYETGSMQACDTFATAAK